MFNTLKDKTECIKSSKDMVSNVLWITPEDFNKWDEDRLNALHLIRSYEIEDALMHLYSNVDLLNINLDEIEIEKTEYDESLSQFKENMKFIINYLRKINL